MAQASLITLVKGAIAGAVGVWMMDRVTWDLYRNEDPKAYRREKRAQIGGRYAAQVAAKRIGDVAHADWSEKQIYSAGQGIHYAIGIMPAIAYALLRQRNRKIGAWRGLAYGLALFVIVDELLNPIMGLTSGPTKYPWQAHARGLIGHLVLGAVTDTMLDVLALDSEENRS